MYNQRSYPDIKYTAQGFEKATIATSGCGPTCMSIVVESLRGESFPPPESASFAIAVGARVPGGTSIPILARRTATKFGLKYKTSSLTEEVQWALKSGGMAIANVAGDRPGRKGVFSESGHYIVLVGQVEGNFIVVDPFMYGGKFNAPYRAMVRQVGNLLYCPQSVVNDDCYGRTPKYHIFTV